MAKLKDIPLEMTEKDKVRNILNRLLEAEVSTRTMEETMFWLTLKRDAEQFLERIPRVSDRTSIDPGLGRENPVLLHDDSACHTLDAQAYALAYALAHPGLFSSEFVKKDSGKLKWSLLPFEELKDVVKVLMHGAEKYSPDNWKKCNDTTRYKDALMRHVVAYVSGDKTDEEFGLSHLAHAICNCLFLMWFDKNKKEK